MPDPRRDLQPEGVPTHGEETALRGDELPVTGVGKPRLRGHVLDVEQRSSFIPGLHP